MARVRGLIEHIIRILSLLPLLGHTVTIDRLAVITDIVEAYQQPSWITLYFCNSFDIFHLTKLLGKKSHIVGSATVDGRPLPYPLPAQHVMFIADFACENIPQLLIDANSRNLFQSPYRWIILAPELTEIIESNLENVFSQVDVLVDSEVSLVLKGTETTYKITQIYKIAPEFPLIYEPFATWTSKAGLTMLQTQRILSRRRANLQGVTLNTCIVITDNDTYAHLTDYRDPHIDTITKVNYVLVNHLSDTINASLHHIVETSWGYQNHNDSSWNGLIGRLNRHEAAIGGTALFFTSDRIPIIDYIAMTTRTRSKFVFRQPKLSYVTNVYQLPFYWTVWVSTVSLVLLGAIGLYTVGKWEVRMRKKHEELQKELAVVELHGTWHEAVFISFAAVCQQGAPVLPDGAPGRLISLLLYLSLMFLYTSYSANIVSLLQSPSTTINTLADLLHSRLGFGVHDTIFNHFYFSTADEPVRKAIYEQKIAPSGEPPKWMTLEEGVARMREGLFAFHFEEGPGYKHVQDTFFEHEKCGLKDIQYLQVPDPYISVQKNISYKKMFKIGFRKIHESGLQEREVNRLYTKKPRCEAHGSGFVSVGLIDCYPTAVVLAGGIILAGMVFLIELYINFRMKSYKRMGNILMNHFRDKERPAAESKAVVVRDEAAASDN